MLRLQTKMTDTRVVSIPAEWSPGGFVNYIVAQGNVPDADHISLRNRECDAFIITLSASLLSDELAAAIAERIVKLPVGWMETFGPRCQYLHDLSDVAGVSIGMQEQVGDGFPMTAWYKSLSQIDEITSYLRTGGQGVSETKVVVVIGPENSADAVARGIAEARSEDQDGRNMDTGGKVS